MKNQNEKFSFVKITAVLFISAFFIFSFPEKTKAAAWPFTDPLANQGLQQMFEYLINMIMGNTKNQVASSLSDQVDKLMGGNGSGNAAFITNWNDYLVEQPKSETKAYMNDYISQMTSGRGSLTGYQAEGFSGSGSYYASLTQMARNTIEQKDSNFKLDYEGNPDDMFKSGGFKDMNNYIAKSPWEANMAVEAEYARKLEENMKVRENEAQSNNGFLGVKDANGNVTYPGVLTKENVANVQNIPNMTLATADGLPEILTAAVNMTLSKAFQSGFSGATKNAQSNSSTQNSFGEGLDDLMTQEGPGARFDSLPSRIMN